MLNFEVAASRVIAQPLRSLGLGISFQVNVLGQLCQDVAQAILLHRADIEAPERVVEAGREPGLGRHEAAGDEVLQIGLVGDIPQLDRPTHEVTLEVTGRLARDDIHKEQIFYFAGELVEEVFWKVAAGEQQDQMLAGGLSAEQL